jgi:NAD(P)-dependent dehydrogenase (short-subunit alcohol dehydrogenase family)
MLGGSAKKRGEEFPYGHLALKRAGQPEEVATLIEYLLGDGSTYITGTAQVVDGGWVDLAH